MLLQYAPQSRAERLIAAGRVALAAVSTLPLSLDRAVPLRHPRVLVGALATYIVYAATVAVLNWRTPRASPRQRVLSHVLDLAMFTLLLYLSGGARSPFTVFFVFALACATVRWEWRGTAWTLGATLLVFLGLGLHGREIAQDGGYELGRFAVRGVDLVVVAVLLGYLSAYERRARAEMAQLAAWPPTVPRESAALIPETLAHAAATLRAPRVLMAWEDPDEPWIQLALWAGNRLEWTREAPGSCDPVVAPGLGSGFLCADAAGPTPEVLHTTPAGMAVSTGPPLHRAVQERFGIRAVLGCELAGEFLHGWLLVLDKAHMTSDDLVLGGVVARQVTARLDQFAALERLRGVAETQTRISVARDLHDGLLQALAAAGLQLEAALGLVGRDPAAAAERLREVQRLLSAEQRDLRVLLRDLKPATGALEPPDVGFAARLEELRDRIARHWRLAVTITAAPEVTRLPRELARGAQLIVQEALVNAARHGHAGKAEVELGVRDGALRIVVVDDGRGFPFRGRRSHAGVRAEGGPVSLWSRIDTLGGSLTVDSGESGARLEILLPLQRAGLAHAR